MRVLARSQSDGLLSLWSLTNGNFYDSFETDSKASTTCLSTSKNGERVALGKI